VERALVLLGFGLADGPGPGGLPPLLAVAQRLAGLMPVPIHRLSPLSDPNAALAALGSARDDGLAGHSQALVGARAQGPARLVVLELDPGVCLPRGGSWVEALGAWRQPSVLVIGASQLPCGWPAAGTALLQHWQVPLLGLLQWGGAWDGAQRRADGLPWLGIAAGQVNGDGVVEGWDDRGEPESALAAVLARRWQHLDLN